MQRFESHIDQSGQFARLAARLGTVLLLCWLGGCGSGVAPATQTAPTTTTASPQTYFAPYVTGLSTESPLTSLTYTIDDVGGTFSQTTYQPRTQPGPQVLNAGVLTVGQRGLRSLGITANYTFSNDTVSYQVTPYPTPGLSGSFAVELAGQAGGLVQMLEPIAGQSVKQPVQPLVAATQCPSFSSAQTYQFVTIPAGADYQLATGNAGEPPIQEPVDAWNPTTDTAYGSVDIVSSGSAVTFQNIHQYRLPSEVKAGETSAPAQVPSSSVTGACGPTFFGNITNVPGELVVTDPGAGSQSNPPQAQVGVGSTGLLVEDNGQTNHGFLAGTSPALPYNNVLGAGTGAVGLPKPSGALDTSALAGAQYLGFIYAAGASSPYVSWSSNLASFGFSSVPSSCASVAASTSTLIYGGDFPNGNPANSSDGFGNCDFAIDLGAQDSSNNGLYPNATVWVGASYAGNSTGVTYSFKAVAVAGQLGGKYAIFLIGLDSSQPWAIYLLQSN